MNPTPNEVIIVLGHNHGCTDLKALREWYPKVKFYTYRKKATFGKLRNLAISKTKSEWCWFVSIDDRPMPNAIKTFNKASEGDYICSQWYTIGLGEPLRIHKSPTPEEMAEQLQARKKGGFIIPHSPFKKWLWEAHPYKNSDLPNYDFLLHCVLSGAKFVKADKPTTTYLRRPDSHARTTLTTYPIHRKANREKRKMQRGVVEFYKTS